MNAWFGTTTSQWKDYKSYYFLIRNYLKEQNCNFPFDWLEEADEFYDTNHTKRNVKKIFDKVLHAIEESDICVIEYTVPNFSSSHQINYALLKRKPTLVLRLKKDNPRFADSYLEAVQSSLLTVSDYSEHTYKQIITDFIEYSGFDKEQQRYNIVLGKKQKHYLDWAANYYKQSRSFIIRELIDKKSKTDKHYKK